MVSLLALPKDQVCSIYTVKSFNSTFFFLFFNANWPAGEQSNSTASEQWQLNSKWTMTTEQQVIKKHMAVAALM